MQQKGAPPPKRNRVHEPPLPCPLRLVSGHPKCHPLQDFQLLRAQRHLEGCSAESGPGPLVKVCEKEQVQCALHPLLWPREYRAILLKQRVQIGVAHSGFAFKSESKGCFMLEMPFLSAFCLCSLLTKQEVRSRVVRLVEDNSENTTGSRCTAGCVPVL